MPQATSEGGASSLDEQQVQAEPRDFVTRFAIVAVGVTATAAVVGSIQGDTVGGAIFGCASALYLVVALGSRHGLPSEWLGHILTGALASSLWLVSLFGGGGLAAPALLALPAVPAMAFRALGGERALVWSLLAVAPAPLLLWFEDSRELVRFTESEAGVLRAVGVVLSSILVGAVVANYEKIRDRQATQLEESRLRSDRARAAALAAEGSASRAAKVKSAFLSTMSHEIRTPLTAVVGVVEVLRGAGLEAQYARQLSLLEGAGRTLLSLVDDILDLSRIESGQLRLEPVPVNLNALLKEAGRLLEPQAAARGIALRVRHGRDIVIHADQRCLRQVVVRLVENSMRFSEEGAITLSCGMEPATQDELVDVSITVSDTGVGIPEAIQRRLSAPLMPTEGDDGDELDAAHLGLSVAAQLIAMMDGTLEVQNNTGTGSMITVRAPFRRAQVADQRPAQVEERGTRPLHVLVAEDNEINREVVRLMLERCGCTVQVAPDGSRAVEAVVATPDAYDLVLMDCQMPEMDGFEATRTLRAAGWTRPIVALTANASPADRMACLEAGMDDFASKPLTLAHLRKVLQEHGRREPKSAEA